MNYYEIGQRIRKFRKASGLSQEELAEKVGISTTHMCHIETGNTKLSLSVLVSITEALDSRADDLLFGKPTATRSAAIEEILSVLEGCNSQQLLVIHDIVKSASISMNKYM